MQLITFPISREEPYEDRQEIVSNLQEALIFLLLNETAQFTFVGLTDATDLSQQLKLEKLYGSFESATEEALKAFQRASELEELGIVDEWTAFSLNAILLRWVLSCNPLQRQDGRLLQRQLAAEKEARL